MVTPNFSNERPHVRMPTNSQPPRNQNPAFWSIYSNGLEDDEPPAVPSKDLDDNPMFLNPTSSSPSLATYTRPRYSSFSVYEPQAASMAFPEPQRPRLASRRSNFDIGSVARHRASKSDTGSAASATSLWRPESDQESFVTTVFTPFDFPPRYRDTFRLAGTSSFRQSS